MKNTIIGIIAAIFVVVLVLEMAKAGWVKMTLIDKIAQGVNIYFSNDDAAAERDKAGEIVKSSVTDMGSIWDDIKIVLFDDEEELETE